MTVSALNGADATIFALASGAGRAGVAIVRLSGKGCRSVLEALSGKPPRAARHAERRTLLDPETGEIIDRALILWFPEPASFSGEDVLELHVHGGPAVLAALFDTLSARPGVRPAEPGEFSRRAFLNGKMDLTEAEGLADLVAAETRQQARQARRQMDGALGRLYERWRVILLDARTHLEAEIDFSPEDEVPAGLIDQVLPALRSLRREIDSHLHDRRRGERLRTGLEVALIGPPNAGKSSLINILAKRDVAIVTEIPGTTRDVLEVSLDLDGYPLNLADMAGLRDTEDPIETLGVERALARATEADIRVVLLDGATWPSVDPKTAALIDEQAVVLLNKSDLLDAPDQIPDDGAHQIEGDNQQVLPISCLTGDGIEQLVAKLTALARQTMAPGDIPSLTRARHRDALVDVNTALGRIDEAAERPELALVAEDLRIATQALGRITGAVGVEDVLDQIFGTFCIGK
jgi:tRNA modification GTPase